MQAQGQGHQQAKQGQRPALTDEGVAGLSQGGARQDKERVAEYLAGAVEDQERAIRDTRGAGWGQASAGAGLREARQDTRGAGRVQASAGAGQKRQSDRDGGVEEDHGHGQDHVQIAQRSRRAARRGCH